MIEPEAREVLPGSGDLMELVFEVCDDQNIETVDQMRNESALFGQDLLQKIVDWMVENA